MPISGAAGLVNSSFYTMTPVFCTAIGLSLHQLTWIMSLTVFAGLAAQWLVGALSDRFDRTIVLSVTAAAITAVSGIVLIEGITSFGEPAFEMGLFGALAFALYPLSAARAHDIFSGKDILAANAGLLFACNIGPGKMAALPAHGFTHGPQSDTSDFNSAITPRSFPICHPIL